MADATRERQDRIIAKAPHRASVRGGDPAILGRIVGNQRTIINNQAQLK